MANEPKQLGYKHHHSLEEMLAFRQVPASEKLRWLESMRVLLNAALDERKREAFQRLRAGQI